MIEVSHLTKLFGDFRAIEDLSFSVETGECVGFLGPNGAGKTTTLRILAGIFPPTSGTVRVGGRDLGSDAGRARRALGYFPENAPYYPEMTVGEYLAFVARAKGLPGSARAASIDEALGACALGDVRRKLVGKLSKGFRQRVGLAQALLGDPSVLILDEPTAGLDPGQVTEIRELVKSFRGQRTIVFSSHILSEVSQVAQRVVILNRGRLIAEDRPEGLARRLAGALPLRLRADASPSEVRSVVASVPGVNGVEIVDDGVRVLVAGDEIVADVSRAVSERGWVVLELRSETLSLEEVFLRLVGDADRPGERA